MLYVSVPFHKQFADRPVRRMKYDHFRNTGKLESDGARAYSPIVILCKMHASEPTNFSKSAGRLPLPAHLLIQQGPRSNPFRGLHPETIATDLGETGVYLPHSKSCLPF